MREVVAAALVVFLAEFGDKSQLMALTFATRYRARDVFLGVVLAATALSALSVVAGSAAAAVVPPRVLDLVAAAAFFGFGLGVLLQRQSDDEEGQEAAARGRAALSVAAMFFVAEFGDKTMFATAALSATGNGVQVWLGSVAGLVAANALAIGAGARFGSRLDGRVVRWGSAAAFFAFSATFFAKSA